MAKYFVHEIRDHFTGAIKAYVETRDTDSTPMDSDYVSSTLNEIVERAFRNGHSIHRGTPVVVKTHYEFVDQLPPEPVESTESTEKTCGFTWRSYGRTHICSAPAQHEWFTDAVGGRYKYHRSISGYSFQETHQDDRD